jgi:site-specific DNA-methyltransferase (adenine-specific)
MRANIEIYNEDCLEAMKAMPDKCFDLAIVDPPYRDENQPTKEMRDKVGGKMKTFGQKPTAEYFEQLFRVSKNQIIWGANNFLEHLRSTNCFLFWYKRNPMENYSDGELAWTSFNKVARCIPIDHFGAHTRDKIKTHPTQKPVDLYKWLLTKYGVCQVCKGEGKVIDDDVTKEKITCDECNGNFKVLDTHLGSGSIGVACWDLQIDLVGYEIDKQYYDGARKRIEQHCLQTQLF